MKRQIAKTEFFQLLRNGNGIIKLYYQENKEKRLEKQFNLIITAFNTVIYE